MICSIAFVVPSVLKAFMTDWTEDRMCTYTSIYGMYVGSFSIPLSILMYIISLNRCSSRKMKISTKSEFKFPVTIKLTLLFYTLVQLLLLSKNVTTRKENNLKVFRNATSIKSIDNIQHHHVTTLYCYNFINLPILN